MKQHTHESPSRPQPFPPPPRFAVDTDLEEGEVDVDLDDADDLDLPEPPEDDEDTQREQIELVGEGYVSLSAYFISQLEDLIDPSVDWILTCLDMRAVQRRFEGNRYRYSFRQGSVYRQGLPRANPTRGD